MPSFPAPTEEIELKIVNYCMETLGLPFGSFWYSWFSAHTKNKNQTIHIECNMDHLENKIRQTFTQVVEVEKFHKLMKISLPEYCDFKFQYYIHFKSKEQL